MREPFGRIPCLFHCVLLSALTYVLSPTNTPSIDHTSHITHPSHITSQIRMAALHNAIIVPFAGIGVADSVDMVLDRDDILNGPLSPLLKDRALKQAGSTPQVRTCVTLKHSHNITLYIYKHIHAYILIFRQGPYCL